MRYVNLTLIRRKTTRLRAKAWRTPARQRRWSHALIKRGRMLKAALSNLRFILRNGAPPPIHRDPIHHRFCHLRYAEKQLPVTQRRSKRKLRELARSAA